MTQEWSPKERADLLRHGVVLDTITKLELAGYSTLAQLAQLDRQQLKAISGERGAVDVRRALGRLMDIAAADPATRRRVP